MIWHGTAMAVFVQHGDLCVIRFTVNHTFYGFFHRKSSGGHGTYGIQKGSDLLVRIEAAAAPRYFGDGKFFILACKIFFFEALRDRHKILDITVKHPVLDCCWIIGSFCQVVVLGKVVSQSPGQCALIPVDDRDVEAVCLKAADIVFGP